MLHNTRVTTFSVSEFLREHKQGGWVKKPPHTYSHTQIRVSHQLESEKVRKEASNITKKTVYDRIRKENE